MGAKYRFSLGRLSRLLVMILFFLFIAVGSISQGYLLLAAEDSQTESVIQIGTYNLDFFTDLNPATGRWCEEHTKHTLEGIKALAHFIDSLDIEVLALQEVEDSAALDILLKYMPQGKYAYIISRQQGPCQRVAILYQPKKVSLVYKGEIPLNPPGHHFLRNGLVVYGKVLPDGFDFTLVDVHLKAYFDPESIATRRKQLVMLGQWVNQYFRNKSNDPDLILAGDFNEHLLTNHSAFELLDNGLGLKDLDADAPNKVCTPPGRYYSDPIDHIIISPDVKEYTGTTILDNYFTDSTLPYRYSYSDHCILWSDFSTSDLDGVQTSTSTSESSLPTIVINEVELNPPGRDAGNEWVELYNPNDYAVDISGWQLQTTHGRTVTLLIPPDTVIGPHGYKVFNYSGQWLDDEREQVVLVDIRGKDMDRTPMLNDTRNDNRDWQRCPDGYDSGSYSDWRFAPSTIGKANNCW